MSGRGGGSYLRTAMSKVWASQVALVVKNSPPKLDTSLIPELGRFLGEGHGNPLQYSCLENSMDGGTWQTTVYGVTKS